MTMLELSVNFRVASSFCASAMGLSEVRVSLSPLTDAVTPDEENVQLDSTLLLSVRTVLYFFVAAS